MERISTPILSRVQTPNNLFHTKRSRKCFPNGAIFVGCTPSKVVSEKVGSENRPRPCYLGLQYAFRQSMQTTSNCHVRTTVESIRLANTRCVFLNSNKVLQIISANQFLVLITSSVLIDVAAFCCFGLFFLLSCTGMHFVLYLYACLFDAVRVIIPCCHQCVCNAVKGQDNDPLIVAKKPQHLKCGKPWHP